MGQFESGPSGADLAEGGFDFKLTHYPAAAVAGLGLPYPPAGGPVGRRATRMPGPARLHRRQ